MVWQLYEETLQDNERLREKLKKTEDDLTECKLRLTNSNSNSVSMRRRCSKKGNSYSCRIIWIFFLFPLLR